MYDTEERYKTWKWDSTDPYRCGALNDTKNTLRRNHKHGVILRCADYPYCKGGKVICKRLTKDKILGEAWKIYKCRCCGYCEWSDTRY